MTFFSTWIAPPLIGAVIGLFTNWLAIKMLFRPLREIRVFGVKLPFTPGILPRERAKLAVSVGDTVARELLTPEALNARLCDPVLRERAAAAILETANGFLAADAGGLLAAPGPDGAAAGPEGPLAEAFRTASKSLASTEAFRTALAAVLRAAAGRLLAVRVGDIMDPAAARALARKVCEEAGGAADGTRLGEIVDSWYAEAAAGKGFRIPLVPAAALDPLLELAAKSLYAASIPVLEGFMADPALRAELEGKALDIVRRALGRLGFFQRLIVNVANYEESIARTMPETITDLTGVLSAMLRDPAMPDRVAAALRRAIVARVDGVSGAGTNADGYAWAISDGRERGIAGLVSGESLKIALAASLKGLAGSGDQCAAAAAERIEGLAEKRLGDFAGTARDLVDSLAGRAADGIARSLSSGDGTALFGDLAGVFVEEFGRGLRGTTVGAALGLSEELRLALAGKLANSVADVLAAQSGRVIEALDIKGMVVARINELDMLEAERIILGVVSKELDWITILGGVLGAAIGIIQSLLYAL